MNVPNVTLTPPNPAQNISKGSPGAIQKHTASNEPPHYYSIFATSHPAFESPGASQPDVNAAATNTVATMPASLLCCAALGSSTDCTPGAGSAADVSGGSSNIWRRGRGGDAGQGGAGARGEWDGGLGGSSVQGSLESSQASMSAGTDVSMIMMDKRQYSNSQVRTGTKLYFWSTSYMNKKPVGAAVDPVGAIIPKINRHVCTVLHKGRVYSYVRC